MIPVVEVGPLFDADTSAWARPDRELSAAARQSGFLCIRGLPCHEALGAAAQRVTIAPLPIDPPNLFAPFQYGDFLWKRITSFVEFRDMEGERVQTKR